MTNNDFKPVLMKYMDNPEAVKLDFYLSHGGYEAAKKALKMEPADLIELVKKSGLRGRGGAGFPTGVKWGFVPKDVKPVYLAVNADEGEPGTFKDKAIIYKDPHQLLEGIIITCWAIDSHLAYIYIRGEFAEGAKILQRAIDEAKSKKILGQNILGTKFELDVVVVRGAGAYICGEETSLLTSLEGNRGYPRNKPPFPAVSGLWEKPTIINNVETLANLPHIINHGVDWFTNIGTEKSPGMKMFGLSGDINKPGLIELPFGISLKDIIYQHGGGVPHNRRIKAVIPGGSSTPFLKGDEIDIPATYEDLQANGSFLGCGSITVIDETHNMIDVMWNVIRFYHHESCGQCTPCREGMGWLERILSRIAHGEGKMSDIEQMEHICHNMKGRTICVLADAGADPLLSVLEKFRDEFIHHIKLKKSIY